MNDGAARRTVYGFKAVEVLHRDFRLRRSAARAFEVPFSILIKKINSIYLKFNCYIFWPKNFKPRLQNKVLISPRVFFSPFKVLKPPRVFPPVLFI